MTVSSLSYRSIKSITNWLVALTIVFMILETVLLVSKSDDLLVGINLLYTIISVVIIIISLFWYYRATKNIHSFGAKEVTSPTMAVVWWFIPLFNLWEPYRFTQQIWKASNPEMKLTNGIEWKTSASSNIVKIGWVLAIVSFIGSLTSGFIDGLILGLSGTFQSYDLYQMNDPTLRFFEKAFNVIFIISMIFFILIIKKISIRQELKSGLSI